MLYLFIIVAALFGEIVVRGGLIVWGDPAVTANNIRHSETLFRIGLVGEMLTCVSDVTLAMILYVLLKPVNRNLALLAAFFRLTFIGFYAVTKLFEVAVLAMLGGGDDLQGLDPQHLDALIYLSLRIHILGYGASLLFFGFCCVLFGYLISRSRYLPRTMGSMLVVGGIFQNNILLWGLMHVPQRGLGVSISFQLGNSSTTSVRERSWHLWFC